MSVQLVYLRNEGALTCQRVVADLPIEDCSVLYALVVRAGHSVGAFCISVANLVLLQLLLALKLITAESSNFAILVLGTLFLFFLAFTKL